MSKSINLSVVDRDKFDACLVEAFDKSLRTPQIKPEDVQGADVISLVKDIAEYRDGAAERMMDDTAIFFADKLVSLTSDQPDTCKMERYRWAKLLHEKGEYHRAAFALAVKNDYHIKDLSCRHLAAKCYIDAKDYNSALDILLLPIETGFCYNKDEGSENEWQSSLELLKAQVYEVLGNRLYANRSYMNAFRHDIYCYEALEALIRFDIITPIEEKELFQIIQTGDKDKASEYIKHFYLKELKKYPNQGHEESKKKEGDDIAEKANDDAMDKNIQKMADFSINPAHEEASIDVQLAKAEKLYDECEYEECYEMADQIYKENSFQPKCILLLLGCLMELNNLVKLQLWAHKLVEIYPENPVSWYAVGCYYYLLSNADSARKYLSKATSIDPKFHPAFLLFGHTFELESQHDLSLAVYLDLSKNMPRSHLPLLYIGVEYSHINNPVQAEIYLKRALRKTNGDDLFASHELAIVHYQKGDFQLAKEGFLFVYNRLATNHLLLRFPLKWEPLLNNLGHTCRHLGDYEEAIEYHEQARMMVPGNSSNCDAIGLCYSLLGQYRTACDWFQKALAIKCDDAFAMTMFDSVYQSLLDDDNKEDIAEDMTTGTSSQSMETSSGRI